MNRFRNQNADISPAQYIEYVAKQLAFLDECEGVEPEPMTDAEVADAQESYQRSVSVNACAASLR